MTQHSRPPFQGLIIATALLGVAACGGGDGAGSAQMKLSVRDAPGTANMTTTVDIE